ncbi:MAG: transglutaminase domain-containing protein, partial [Alphaproteobacteria bacterium]|nr:transglutaminase domain-containing protein [Alphaproteobacteria bacterium]
EEELMKFKGSMKTLPQKRWNAVQRYEAYSSPRGEISEKEANSHYLTVPLSRKDKNLIRGMFPGTDIDEVSKSIKKLFLKSQFSYSLAPGKIQSLKEFLDKKVGVCSHYASAVAIILRLKNIPTRLVSGFMGGSYNKYANFYLVTQNDAHVWVEAYSDGKWLRLDPTAWISPERVIMGGAAFIENVRSGVQKRESFFMIPAFINDLKLWFNQWDFLFYQWLESMDYGAQEEWLTGLKIKRQWLFSLIPLMMVIFMAVYALYLNYKNKKLQFSEYQNLWILFYKKMSKKGYELSPVSIETSHGIIQGINEPEVLKIWLDLRALTFEGSHLPLRELKKRIKKI